jgi:alanyl-tRNA synthetase
VAAKSIDTGLGLDRLAAVLQDVENVCTTDLLMPTLTTVQELAGGKGAIANAGGRRPEALGSALAAALRDAVRLMAGR